MFTKFGLHRGKNKQSIPKEPWVHAPCMKKGVAGAPAPAWYKTLVYTAVKTGETTSRVREHNPMLILLVLAAMLAMLCTLRGAKPPATPFYWVDKPPKTPLFPGSNPQLLARRG